MKVISESSELEIAHQRAMPHVEWALRELAANLIRVTRGAGAPQSIGRQAQELIDNLVAYRDAVGHLPDPDQIASALDVDKTREIRLDKSDADLDDRYAIETIISGSLRTAAARLLRQRLQESAGEREMDSGLRELEVVKEARRRKRAAEVAAAAVAVAKKYRASPKRKAKPKAGASS
jgi:hypothetical protein